MARQGLTEDTDQPQRKRLRQSLIPEMYETHFSTSPDRSSQEDLENTIEYVPILGQEKDAERWKSLNNGEPCRCLICRKGATPTGNKTEGESELEKIHQLYKQLHGKVDDQVICHEISNLTDELITKPTMEAWNATHPGKTPQEIPDWKPMEVAKHFEVGGLYLWKQMGDNIKTINSIIKEIQYTGIVKEDKLTKTRSVDERNLKAMERLMRLHADLSKTYSQLYTNKEDK